MTRPIIIAALAVAAISRALPGDKISPDLYRATDLPPGEKKDAHAVIRYDLTDLRVDGIRDAFIHHHRIVTILDAEGRKFGDLVLYHDKFTRVDRLEGRVFSADGGEVRSLRDEDVKDYPATDGFSLYDDSRQRVAELIHSTYPYTVEFQWDQSLHGYIDWPAWYPQEREAFVESSRYDATVPNDVPVRYWKDMAIEPTITREKNRTIYSWSASSLAPFEEERSGPAINDQYGKVRLEPTKFEIDGHAGDLSSWKSFGLWFYELQNNRQTLPEKTLSQAMAITSGISDRREKIRRLYEFMQSTTRYVSVQLGIGGWQPYDAAYVSDRGYGDCKALTNYMLALLKAVQIPAYPAFIQHGSPPRDLIMDFPYNRFNHVILCVPDIQDTTWLECTSQTMPFGHIGGNNENRYALLITPEGGVLVRTPASRAEENCQIRTATVDMSSTGAAAATVVSRYGGDQQDAVRDAMKDVTKDKREEWIKEDIDIPAFTLQKFDYTDPASGRDLGRLDLQMQLPGYASIASDRLLFKPNLMERRTYVPPLLATRRFPVVGAYPYLDIDSITYHLPANFDVDVMPKPVTIETDFGSYHMSIVAKDPSTLLYVRRLERKAIWLPPEKYGDYRTFFQGVAQADNANASLIRKK